jgi:hypothetical protein
VRRARVAAVPIHLWLSPLLIGREENAGLPGIGVDAPRQTTLPVHLESSGPGKHQAVGGIRTDGVRSRPRG